MVSPSQYSTFSIEDAPTTLPTLPVSSFAMNVSVEEESMTISNCSINETVAKYGCRNSGFDNPEYQRWLATFADPRFYCEGVSISVLGILGIFGNLLALIVLSRPNLRDIFHQLLFAVASFDLLYIVVGGVNYTFKAFEANSDVYVYLYPHVIHPFTHIAATGVIYMTVAITIERYLGLCHPFLPPTSRKAWFYVLPVVIISVAMNVPKFMEVEHHWENWTDIETNKTVELITYRNTRLRYDDNYILGYLMWSRLFSDCIIPVIILIYLNARIIAALISATKVQRFNSARKQRKEINLTIILLCIVFIFFCCHAARIILDVYEFLNIENVLACQNLARCARQHFLYIPNNFIHFLPKISHMMQILNSSTNFIVYCLVGHNFRRELCKTFGIRRYSSVPNNFRSLAYDNSTFGNQGPSSGKGSRYNDKDFKKKDLETRNGKVSTITISPSSVCNKDEPSNNTVFDTYNIKDYNNTNGCNGHKTSFTNHHTPTLQSTDTQNSFPMTTTSTSISY